MRPGGGRGRGVTALFAGVSGTGKSMSAEALAGELGVPLFRVELASVVDKYIGETEKNLEEVFRSVETMTVFSFSMKPMHCSANDLMYPMRAIGTPTSRSLICCNALSNSTDLPS
jgi:hypothetical protein